MNCVISGESSFISNSLGQQLLKSKNRVVFIDTNQMPLSEIDALEEYKPDVFFHFLKEDFDESKNKNLIYSNVDVVFDLLEQAKKFNSNFLLIGSKPMKGKPDRNISRLSQYFAEEISQMFCENHGVSLAVIRFFEVFGEFCDNKNSLIYRLQQAKKSNNIFVYKGSENERKGFIHVDDVISGILQIAKHKWRGQIFNLSMQKNYSIKELVELFQIENFAINPIQKKECWEPIPDASFTEQKLNWNCKISMENYVESFLSKQVLQNPRNFLDSLWNWTYEKMFMTKV